MVNTNVLLVEDDPYDQEIFKMALRDVAPTLSRHVVDNGVQAVDYLNGIKPEVPSIIFTDINMPRMNGWELITHIRSCEWCHRVPIIVLSTSPVPRDIERAMHAGANSYLVKPSSYEEVCQYIQQSLKENGLLRTSTAG